jgi:hypothetical protein
MVIRKYGFWIARDQGKCEHLEKGGVGSCDSFSEYVFFVPNNSRSVDISCLMFDFWDGLDEFWPNGRWNELLNACLFFRILVESNLDKSEELVPVQMKLVEG